MSGIEVVGLVLGSIPLIISGLEHYAEGVESIKVIKNAAQEFRAVARKLDAENVVFRNTLEMLLQDCVDVRTQKELLADVGGTAWTSEDVQDALQHRLQSSYTSYIDHVKHIQKTLGEFTVRLEINESGKGPFDNPKSFRQAFKRLKFALKKQAYLDLVEDIRSDNSHLHRLTGQSKALQTGRRARKVPNFDIIRSTASNIFENLQRLLNVSCVSSHRASICLQPPPGPETTAFVNRSSGGGNDAHFRVILHHVLQSSGSRSEPQWLSEETEIRTMSSLAQAEITKQIEVLAISQKTAMKRSVRFQETVVQTTSLPAIATSSQPSNDPSSPIDEIQDLCQKLQALHMKKCGHCLGFVTSSLSKHEILRPQKQLMNKKTNAFATVHTLDAIIRGEQGNMTNADANRLAVSLATGMLRLHDTPWLQPRWNKTDINVIENNGKIVATHPFVSRVVPSQATIAAVQAGSFDNTIIRNPTLFALGILLIELCMQKPIDKFYTHKELDTNGVPDELSTYKTAVRLLDDEQISDRFGKPYSDVVYRCIHCNLNQTKPLLSDTAFKAAVYSDIVRELEENCQRFLGTRQ